MRLSVMSIRLPLRNILAACPFFQSFEEFNGYQEEPAAAATDVAGWENAVLTEAIHSSEIPTAGLTLINPRGH